ncbi:MAG: hypothetical protein IJ060_02555 [Oscillospiraceae bacterium]|nr:hypothetical protein [Oscillospiraceae bacterium]
MSKPEARRRIEELAQELHAICTKEDIPYILAAEPRSDGRTLRTANGTVTDVTRLTGILLVQMSEDTENDLDEVLAYLRLMSHHARDIYRSNH